MTHFFSTSPKELADRRRRLRQRRHWKSLQSAWRSLLVWGMAGGLLWVVAQPIWTIRNSHQVEILGNQLLSVQTIQSLLPIHYPQSLLTLQPQVIAQDLQERAPIAEAHVTRRLFPPGLTIHIQERHPVAIAYPVIVNLEAAPVHPQSSSLVNQVGLLDERGNWISMERYTALNQFLAMPSLEVIGMREGHQDEWQKLYAAVSASPVMVSSIDWRNPTNLILTTELGVIHLGPLSDRLPNQLRALDHIRHLPEKIASDQIEYIDLKNPDSPLVELIPFSESEESNSPEAEIAHE
jgi:cell division protein FtsQ